MSATTILPPSALTVSLVIYATPPEELATLFAALRATVSPEAVCIVDNGADPLLASAVTSAGFIYLNPGRNLGFGAGHNAAVQALAQHQAQAHLLLNPDIECTPEAIHASLAFLSEHPDIGLVVPDIHFPDGSRQHLCKLLPSPIDLLVRRFLPSCAWKKNLEQRYELRDWSYTQIADIPCLSGCFMLIRQAAWQQTGGFDERFFMYMEDLDLCRRIGNDWRTVFYPEAQVIHAYCKGSYHNRKLLQYHCQSALRYFCKWGWFFDKERRQRNRACLQRLGLPK